MKRGDVTVLDIEGYAYEGKGIAKIDSGNNDGKKFVIFVNGAYPGDKVEVLIRKAKRNFAEAIVQKIIKPSELRIEPKCKYFGVCGGCKQQNMNYQAQLKFKQMQVSEIFDKMGGFTDFEFEDIVPSENIFHYRNKMEFSFSDKRWITPAEIKYSDEITDRNFALGLHVPRVYDKVLDIDECFLHSETGNRIINFTREFFKQRNTSVYTTHTHEGFLRNLVIKNSYKTNDLMVNLVTSEEDEKLVGQYSEEIVKEIPEITTVVNNVNLKKAQVAIGDYEKVFFGKGFIHDMIGDFKFRISPNSFFQTNTLQAQKLYDTILDFAQFAGDEVVYDLYSGAGTISIYLSPKVKKVYAFESVDDAVKDAKANSVFNEIDNISFHTADLNRSFLPIQQHKKLDLPDVIVADPPRNGMNPKTIKDIIALSPKNIVYVSCNPTTQVRDIKMLTEAGYKLIKIRPVDMFPHTYHIENVALLTKE